MPCYHPLPGWFSKRRNESGKRSVVFNLSDGYKDKAIQVPCGRCIGCRLERSRQWAVRCVHEAKMWEDNSFVTLTYNDENLPSDGSLNPRHFVLFMKRLRERRPGRVRFFHCGEYGETLGRPHHHAILFNCDFPDKRLYSGSGETSLYTSEELEDIWRFGFCTVGAASFESAAYIARYSLKKITGPPAAEHYQGRIPEYLTMSRKPGIGRMWLDEYWSDVFPSDEVIVRGVKCKPPVAYVRALEKQDALTFRRIKRARKAAAEASTDNSGKRLIVREVVRQAAVNSLRRGYDDSSGLRS